MEVEFCKKNCGETEFAPNSSEEALIGANLVASEGMKWVARLQTLGHQEKEIIFTPLARSAISFATNLALERSKSCQLRILMSRAESYSTMRGVIPQRKGRGNS